MTETGFDLSERVKLLSGSVKPVGYVKSHTVFRDPDGRGGTTGRLQTDLRPIFDEADIARLVAERLGLPK